MEAPEGYRLVRIGVKGRIPRLENLPESELTPQQKRKLKYRTENKEKVKEYNRLYYAKKVKKNAE